ncbi:amidase [Propylenella binzhouense]|uniref:Amidase n=1 Tax=Propylenella binzhouense TaxID=2555902 RepID=A0A964WUL2_9HYPH|nr:amidase [Propylenella binzhouense]MYZ49191.1 amidase [Propylenella binzhouense]
MATETPNELSLAESARLVAAGELSSTELVAACLDRIAAREEDVQAWASLDPEHAMAQARACDAARAGGPLHGVPVGIKDVLDTADLPTEMGSPIYKGNRTLSDSSAVAMLRAAGAVILGKTVTCEFAGVAPGPTRNPLDLARTPGGSSSGSGAAVADRMVPMALGTQTGGSVLRPASFCGVVGFKPTYNTINRAGLKFAAENLDTIGFIARSVEDVALSLRVLTQRADPPGSAGPARPRIGLCRTYLWEKAEPETRAALDHAAAAAAAAGAEIVEFELPASFAGLTEARETINNVERARSLAWEWANHRAAISVRMARSIELGQAISGETYHATLQFADTCRLALDGLMEGFDALIAPAVNGEAPVGLAYAGDPSFQGLWTLLHVPAITVPALRGSNGMPVGVQLVARRYADEALLRTAGWLVEVAGLDGRKAMADAASPGRVPA